MPSEEDIQTITGDSLHGSSENSIEEREEEGEQGTFRSEWLEVDVFKNWLSRVTDDGSRAKCVACNVFLRAVENDLYRHAADQKHKTAVQTRTVEQLLSGKLTQSGGTLKTVPTRKIIVIKRNSNGSGEGVTPVSIPTSTSPQVTVKRPTGQIQVIPASQSSWDAKRVRMDDSKGDKRKPKPFRPEWLEMDIFKDWLAPDPDNMCKARCVACNTVLNAGKSELEKHAAGARHSSNLEALRQTLVVQQMLDEANKDVHIVIPDEEDEFDHEDDDMEDDDNDGLHAVSRNSSSMDHMMHSERQLDALTRIASSMENLTAATTAALENIVKNQETLTEILAHLVNK